MTREQVIDKAVREALREAVEAMGVVRFKSTSFFPRNWR